MVIIFKTRSIIFFAACLIICLAGCNNSSSNSPGQTFLLFWGKIQEGNYTQAAQYVSSQTAVEYQTDIPSFLTLMSKGGNPDSISRWTSVKVISEQIDVTKAVAKVKITAKPDGKETTYDSEMPMSKEDDIWKLRLTSRGYVIQ
ncbi:hypothetical protein Dtox_1317 [Desulfofarcimen acetoxidans DSM 771]|uniref:Uncharacterized protein n=1 Tax=Desulfofarcimen acetoxidans (strain ATCC 49208 / DSM 771 / KCTC 5769 / VKM B-1644 / 5575) TaxID=485916 RepID=C8W6B0_DESAS|nr:DUF4878 domain-containing protein [Desulfofarcimen acetoxidans]ACV62199.1 hypothetical protein Dtox_1317 [Desulfofarcimen acetoxidans DSM 771]